ncbi:hypothetical protein EGR_00397 [Echinococcus granulosus]|uniref:Uncharacterized protein n=1 Tax=Echinococcus granulosus TaxID=6210 RepID=W6UUZ4_ECHGR|nr:hypothetical protein EGR_00397 [Echinococcus granulosus]EUB65128.1 hypothetical protein EGR_00397 [Echinococcus granulosus]
MPSAFCFVPLLRRPPLRIRCSTYSETLLIVTSALGRKVSEGTLNSRPVSILNGETPADAWAVALYAKWAFSRFGRSQGATKRSISFIVFNQPGAVVADDAFLSFLLCSVVRAYRPRLRRSRPYLLSPSAISNVSQLCMDMAMDSERELQMSSTSSFGGGTAMPASVPCRVEKLFSSKGRSLWLEPALRAAALFDVHVVGDAGVNCSCKQILEDKGVVQLVIGVTFSATISGSDELYALEAVDRML